MPRTDKNNAAPTRGVFAAALERTLGFLERMRLIGRRGRTACEKKKPGRAQKRRAARRIILKTEISRLEKEIDRVHAHIVQGAGNLRRNAADAPALPDLVKLARDLREQLANASSSPDWNERPPPGGIGSVNRLAKNCPGDSIRRAGRNRHRVGKRSLPELLRSASGYCIVSFCSAG